MNFSEWLTASSADPKKTAATIKGILLLFVPRAVNFLGFDADLVDGLVGAVAQIVEALLVLSGLGITTFGILRKLCVPKTPSGLIR